MWALAVVVSGVDAQHRLEVAAAEDQQPVESFGDAGRPDGSPGGRWLESPSPLQSAGNPNRRKSSTAKPGRHPKRVRPSTHLQTRGAAV